MQRENEILAILDDLTNRVVAIASDVAGLKKKAETAVPSGTDATNSGSVPESAASENTGSVAGS